MTIKESKTLGEFIRSYRLGEEMTQIEFAKLLGISKQRLCDIEHNRGNVSITLCKEIANSLDLPPEWLAKISLQNQIEKAGLNLKVS